MKNVKIAGVIAECNPFHEGHRYLIEKIREETGADYVILAMAGAFVQRGEPALVRTAVRTQMALAGGADAVFLLPVRYALSSAEFFAKAGVTILNGVGCDLIAFGAEHPLPEILTAAKDLAAETPEQGDLIRRLVRGGCSYPKARAAAFPEYADLLSSPNDILAAEYAKAWMRLSGGAYPTYLHAVRRVNGVSGREGGAVYPDARGSSLRKRLLCGDPHAYDAVPEACRVFLQKELDTGGAVLPDDFSLPACLMIRYAAAEGTLEDYADVSADLAGAIRTAAAENITVTGMAEAISAKNRITARVKRSILHIVLDIRKEENALSGIYTQLLGFRKTSDGVLGVIDSRRDIPLLAKPADHARVLPEDADRRFMEDANAEDVYEAARSLKTGEKPVSVFKRPVIIL